MQKIDGIFVEDKNSDISFNITTNKKTKDIQIDVLDEMFFTAI